jgi:predicted SAM-dependent methyltransferase
MLSTLWRRLRYIATSGLRRRFRDFALRDTRPDAFIGREKLAWREVFVLREDLARRYLTGSGIEIGALTFPLRVPPRVKVRYVDYLPRQDLVRINQGWLGFHGIDPGAIPKVDVVDDAGRLAKFPDESVDFVVANHVLEHTEDPIDALAHMLRVIRVGGILFVAVPDARHTYDAPRSRTTIEHVLRDHRDGPHTSRQGHYEEWARILEGKPEGLVAERTAEFAREDARLHFHVWELEGFLTLLAAIELPCELELAQVNGFEFEVILRKIAPGGGGSAGPMGEEANAIPTPASRGGEPAGP